MKRGVFLLLFLLPAVASGAGFEPEDNDTFRGMFDRLWLQAGGYVHYGGGGDYRGLPVFAGVEGRRRSGWLVGVSLFNNSFGQFSQYFYLGREWEIPLFAPEIRFRLTGGALHGYTGRYEDKVPFNHGGWSPAIIPGLSWKTGRNTEITAAALGTSGILFLFGWSPF